MDKGTRVEITGGRNGMGIRGSVFWIGEDRYNENAKRFGVHGDDGETYWVSSEDVEETDAPPPAHEGPEPNRGDRVTWSQGEGSGEGEIFWVGPSKHGAGFRVGVKCDDEETRWFDARQITILDPSAPPVSGTPASDPPPSMPPAPPPSDEPPASWSDDDIPF